MNQQTDRLTLLVKIMKDSESNRLYMQSALRLHTLKDIDLNSLTTNELACIYHMIPEPPVEYEEWLNRTGLVDKVRDDSSGLTEAEQAQNTKFEQCIPNHERAGILKPSEAEAVA